MLAPSKRHTPDRHLSAILDACSHATRPPTLRQLLSHPYFAEVDGFTKDDLRAAYQRWRSRDGAPHLAADRADVVGRA